MKRGLVLSSLIFAELVAEARRIAPLEACGILAGRAGRVERFLAMTNADASAEHFTMIPREQFDAVKAMRRDSLTMLAIWHSHPATPARMSDEDLRLALTPGTVHAILSLAGAAPVLRGFAVVDGRPEEVDIIVDGEGGFSK